MNVNINNILLASIFFIVYFSIASSFVYPKIVPTYTQTTTTPQLQSAASISEPITFTYPYSLVLEPITTTDHIDLASPHFLEQPIETIPTQQVEEPTETIPTQQVEEPLANETIEVALDIPQDVEAIISNLKKRDTLKLFTPLAIKRRIGKVEKNLATTRTEILALYKENPEWVVSVLQTHLPELFT